MTFYYSAGLCQASQVALVVKNPPANVGDMSRGFNPWVGKIPWRRGWQSTTGKYPCLENPMDRGAWWATAHRVTKSCTRLKQLSMRRFVFVCIFVFKLHIIL